MRQLVWMAEARASQAWDHTSMVLALLYNVNRDPKRSRAMRVEDVHPYMRRRLRGTPMDTRAFETLRCMARVERTVRARDVVVN